MAGASARAISWRRHKRPWATSVHGSLRLSTRLTWWFRAAQGVFQPTEWTHIAFEDLAVGASAALYQERVVAPKFKGRRIRVHL